MNILSKQEVVKTAQKLFHCNKQGKSLPLSVNELTNFVDAITYYIERTPVIPDSAGWWFCETTLTYICYRVILKDDEFYIQQSEANDTFNVNKLKGKWLFKIANLTKFTDKELDRVWCLGNRFVKIKECFEKLMEITNEDVDSVDMIPNLELVTDEDDIINRNQIEINVTKLDSMLDHENKITEEQYAQQLFVRWAAKVWVTSSIEYAEMIVKVLNDSESSRLDAYENSRLDAYEA